MELGRTWVGELLVVGHVLQPEHTLELCTGLVDVLATDLSLVLLGNDCLHRLCIIDPFESGKSVADRHDSESLEVEVPVLACRIRCEYLIHNTEQLLNPLVESQIFSSLDQEVVVLLVATVYCDLLWPTNGAEDQTDFLEAGNL